MSTNLVVSAPLNSVGRLQCSRTLVCYLHWNRNIVKPQWVWYCSGVTPEMKWRWFAFPVCKALSNLIEILHASVNSEITFFAGRPWGAWQVIYLYQFFKRFLLFSLLFFFSLLMFFLFVKIFVNSKLFSWKYPWRQK